MYECLPPPPAKYTIAIIVFDLRIIGGVETISYDLAIGLQERGHKVIVFHIQDLNKAPFAYRHSNHRDLSPLHTVQLKTGLSRAASSVQKTPPTHTLKNIFFSLFKSFFLKAYHLHRRTTLINQLIIALFNAMGKWIFTEKFTNLNQLLREHKVDIVIDNYFKFRPLFPKGIPAPIRHCVKVVHADFDTIMLINAMRNVPKIIRNHYHHLIILTNQERPLWEALHSSVRTIPNFIIPQKNPSKLNQPIILAVARLEDIKALHRLIIIFWAIIKNKPITINDFITHFNHYPHYSQHLSFTGKSLRKKSIVRHFIEEALHYTAEETFPSWTLRIIGDGTDRKKLEALTAFLGIKDRVIFEGTKTREELYPMLQDASIFAISSFCEGLPLNILEAISMGLPIIGFNVVGCKDLVKDNGFLVENHSLRAYAENLQNLMKDPILRQNMGKASFDLAKNFYKDDILNQWEALLYS